MREIIAFKPNVPITVALAYADGLQVEGRFGDQIMYTLADERVMYVPPLVGKRLAELGVQPGEPFIICKAERKQGNRRLIEWQVKKDDTPNDPPRGFGAAFWPTRSEVRISFLDECIFLRCAAT